MESFGNRHRVFLQGIMSRGIMNVDEVKKLYLVAHNWRDKSNAEHRREPLVIKKKEMWKQLISFFCSFQPR